MRSAAVLGLGPGGHGVRVHPGAQGPLAQFWTGESWKPYCAVTSPGPRVRRATMVHTVSGRGGTVGSASR
jgi:hypothetical protein